MSETALSAVMCVHDEEDALEACLERLGFADEIVVVLDDCRDGSRAIAERFTDRIIEGAWDIEGDRRNAAIEAAWGSWILEIDAEHPRDGRGDRIEIQRIHRHEHQNPGFVRRRRLCW